jgi:hypothetical protein
MVSFLLPSRLLPVLSFVFSLSGLTAALDQPPHQVRFRVTTDSMMIVPVTINGSGPFDFMLDTGNTKTLIDQRLAEELHLPSAGARPVTAPGKQAVTFLAHTDSVSTGGANVRGLNLFVIEHLANGPTHHVRGSLGEDFMRHFDFLIDNRHHLIQFEPGPGPLSDMLAGERLPLSLNGSTEKEQTENRLIITGQCFESAGREMKFQLDSGVSEVVLFSGLNRLTVSLLPPRVVAGPLGGGFEASFQIAHLQLGKRVFNKAVAVPEGNLSLRGVDVDGLLPTALFRSIFISHSGKFVILDPFEKPTTAKSKLVSHAHAEDSDARL